MREHHVEALLHVKHKSERPMEGKDLPSREVIREQGANHAAEIVIERDGEGRLVKKTTRELQQTVRELSVGGDYRLQDISPEAQQSTVERFEYDDKGRMTRSVEEKFNPIAPDHAYFTRTLDYTYADNGAVESKRVEFKGVSGADPLTYASRVTKWDGDKPVEFAIDDNRSRENPKRINRVRTYDDAGRVSTETDVLLGEDGKETEVEAYRMSYDGDGRILEVHSRRGGDDATWKYEYAEGTEGRTVTRRSFGRAGREEGGERVTLGPNGAKQRYESWFSPDAKFGDTTWTTT